MFGFLVDTFNILLYRPLFNLLVLIYNYLPGHDFGLSIISVTVVIRLILYPISVKAFNSQIAIQKLQPQLQEIQKKFKHDKEKQSKETLELYRREKINPFSGILLAILQLPILIALYRVFQLGLNSDELKNLYQFISSPVHIDPMFLGLIDLSKPNLLFAVLAGIVQFFQTKMLMPKFDNNQPKMDNMALMMQKQMIYLFPFLTVVILFKLPSALGLYWIAGSIFSIVQQYIALKKTAKSGQ